MKNKFFISAVLILVLQFNATAQTLVTQAKPVNSKEWGYANLKGELIIPATYRKCYRFSPEGLAVIYNSDGRQYYFINLKGEKLPTEIKDFKIKDGLGFDVDGFKNGWMLVKPGEKWGYINAQGKLGIAAKYDDATDFNDGFASANIGSKYVILNAKGEETPVSADNIADIRTFNEGLAPFKSTDKKFGFISSDGKVAVSAQYESVGYFVNGLAWAKQGGMLGYINPKGEWVIKPQFDAGKEFDKESGLARIKKGDKWAYVKTSGEIVYINDTDVWGDFSEGLAEGRKNDKKGFYNSKGEWTIPPQFDGTRDFHNGYAAAKVGGKWGVIDKQGKWVISPAFDGIKDMELVNQ